MFKRDLGAVDVVSGWQPGLEKQDGTAGFGKRDAVDLDPDVAMGAQRVDSDVRVARVSDDVFVFFEPVKRVPFEPHVARDRAVGVVDTCRGLVGAPAAGQRMQPRWAKLQPLWVALVKQMLHAHVRYRNVVLRVVRHLPDIAGADRVEDKRVIEIPTHAAWRRLDAPPLCRHLWIVAVAVRRLRNHWWSLLNSRRSAMATILLSVLAIRPEGAQDDHCWSFPCDHCC